MHNKSMNKIFLQFSKAQLLLALCLLNIFASAGNNYEPRDDSYYSYRLAIEPSGIASKDLQSEKNSDLVQYNLKAFIGLNNPICKNASKHLTLEDSGFFEYIGAGAEKIFECGGSTEAGNEPCRKDAELICRNANKKHILQRSDSLLIGANNFLANAKKFKNRKKLKRAVQTQTKINKNWASSTDILSLISSLEREIIFTASLLPDQTFASINNELKLKHDQSRQKVLEEQRLLKEASLKEQKQQQAQQEKVTLEKQKTDEQLTVALYLLGIFAIVILVGILTNKWIFFDTEKDFFMTLGLLVSIATLFYMLEEYDYSQNVSLGGSLFYWSVTGISGLLSIWLLIKTYTTSIKGNGFFIGTFVYLFKIGFSIIMALFIVGKIGDILNNKDRRTTANRAPVLAIFALIAIFWKPIKLLLINGDKVRVKRKGSSLEAKNINARSEGE